MFFCGVCISLYILNRYEGGKGGAKLLGIIYCEIDFTVNREKRRRFVLNTLLLPLSCVIIIASIRFRLKIQTLHAGCLPNDKMGRTSALKV